MMSNATVIANLNAFLKELCKGKRSGEQQIIQATIFSAVAAVAGLPTPEEQEQLEWCRANGDLIRQSMRAKAEGKRLSMNVGVE